MDAGAVYLFDGVTGLLKGEYTAGSQAQLTGSFGNAVAGANVMMGYPDLDIAVRNLQTYMNLFSADMQGRLQGLLLKRDYATVQTDISLTNARLKDLQSALGIIQNINTQDYASIDTGLRNLLPYMQLLSADLRKIVSDVAEGYYKDKPYSTLLNNLANIDAEIAHHNEALNIINPLVDRLGNIDYYLFDTELRRLSDYLDVLTPALVKEVQQIVTSPALSEMDARQLTNNTTQ